MSMRAGLYRISPTLYSMVDKIYGGSWLQKLRAPPIRHNEAARAKALVDEYFSGEAKSRGGPFAGLTLMISDGHSMSLPKIVGSYEAPISEVIGEVAGTHERIINIGAAEGYYAVGLATRFPKVKVYAFDTNSLSQRECADFAALNGVADRVSVAGECTPATLKSLASKRSFILCDIEGGEVSLFDEDTVTALGASDLLIETHDEQLPGSRQRLIERFRKSHDIIEYHDSARDLKKYPALNDIPAKIAEEMIDEKRNLGQSWLVIRSRQKNG